MHFSRQLIRRAAMTVKNAMNYASKSLLELDGVEKFSTKSFRYTFMHGCHAFSLQKICKIFFSRDRPSLSDKRLGDSADREIRNG